MSNNYTHKFKESSFIVSTGWNPEQRILVVLFKSTMIWAYENVPFEVYLNFIEADSAGNFFNNNIRNVYSAYNITAVPEFNG